MDTAPRVGVGSDVSVALGVLVTPGVSVDVAVDVTVGVCVGLAASVWVCCAMIVATMAAWVADTSIVGGGGVGGVQATRRMAKSMRMIDGFIGTSLLSGQVPLLYLRLGNSNRAS